MKYTYKIYSPNGNHTALVETIPDKITRKMLNDQILKRWSSVEQVGFVDIGRKQLEMAGGEFCGNATRCAAYILLGGKRGKTKIRVSGTDKMLSAGISNRDEVWTQIPTSENLTLVEKNRYGYRVTLEGITHVVTYINRAKDSKKRSLNILRNLNLLDMVPAAGVMFVSTYYDHLQVEPVVWVKEIKTIYKETACASGTAAIAIVESQLKKQSINRLPIIQPSNEIIYASINIKDGQNVEAVISGDIKTIENNLSISIPDDMI